jgi:hypothetical protein
MTAPMRPFMICCAATPGKRAGRVEDPRAVVPDTQSIRAADHMPTATTGNDAGKRVPGRKRGPAVDVLRLIIASW